jgi:hypothetical protein
MQPLNLSQHALGPLRRYAESGDIPMDDSDRSAGGSGWSRACNRNGNRPGLRPAGGARTRDPPRQSSKSKHKTKFSKRLSKANRAGRERGGIAPGSPSRGVGGNRRRSARGGLGPGRIAHEPPRERVPRRAPGPRRPRRSLRSRRPGQVRRPEEAPRTRGLRRQLRDRGPRDRHAARCAASIRPRRGNLTSSPRRRRRGRRLPPNIEGVFRNRRRGNGFDHRTGGLGRRCSGRRGRSPGSGACRVAGRTPGGWRPRSCEGSGRGRRGRG